MKIAVVQIDCIPGNLRQNLRKICSMIEQTKLKGADLVVFPELSDTGYVMAEMPNYAVDPQMEITLDLLTASARENKINVIAGIAERINDTLYNTAVVIDPTGEVIAKYRKIHLYTPSGEGVFSSGDALVTLPLGDFTIGLMICYDTRFPELARSLALAGADLIIIPTAWPFPRVEHWQILTRARAIENQCYIVGANRVGTDANASFCGNSRVIDPHGVVVSAASEDQEEIIFAEIDRGKLDFIRNRMQVFNHRRPDIYQM